MTATLPDVDVLEALDWHHESPCSAVACHHGRPPARWRLVWDCRCVALLCDPCKARVDAALTLSGDESVTARCAKCDRVRTLRVRDIVVTLEPLA